MSSATDEVGVRIVASLEPEWGDSAAWVVRGPVLDLSVTGDGPQHEFYRVMDAVQLADGSLVVANDGTSEIRFYSPEGRFRVSAGRNGDGPGEFRRIRTLSRTRGDSVVVHDPLLNRLTILASDGSLGRVISLPRQFRHSRSLRAYDDSTFLGFTYSLSDMKPGRYRFAYAAVRLGPEGAVLDTVAAVGGAEGFLTGSVDGPLPFSKEGHLSVVGRAFILGGADSMAFQRFTEPGVLSQVVSVPGYDLALTSEQKDSTRWSLLHRADGRPHPPAILEAVENTPIPDHRPGYSRLILDAAGYVWAARYYRGMHAARTVEWEVFGPNGEWQGLMQTPVGFSVLRIGRDMILGVQRDEYEVEHVQVLELVRGE